MSDRYNFEVCPHGRPANEPCKACSWDKTRELPKRVTPVEAQTFLLQTPAHARQGIPPVECRYHCLYTQVKPCRDIYSDPEFWCGFCSETNAIVAERVAPVEADDEFPPCHCGALSAYECTCGPSRETP
jgi:hypothetical protein